MATSGRRALRGLRMGFIGWFLLGWGGARVLALADDELGGQDLVDRGLAGAG